MAYDMTDLGVLLDALNGLNESEKYNISQAIFLQSFKTVNIKENHPTMGEVHKGNKIPIINMDGGYGNFPSFDGCALPSCDIANDWSEFSWCLTEIGCEVTICMKDLAPKFLAFWNNYRKMNEGDIASAFVQFVVEIFQDAHLKAEARVAYFGDTNAQINTTPEGEEPTLVDDPLFNGCDGFVTQMDALSTANADLLVTVTENAGANVTAQTITDGQDIYDYLLAMYNKAVIQPWFDPSKLVFRINRSLANVLVAWLNTQSTLQGINCACIDVDKAIGPRGFTVDNLLVFGVPVEVYDFEEMMKAGGNSNYYFDGTKFTKYKNVMILAEKDSMLLGYETTDSLSQFNVGWDERKREIFIQGSSMFGAGISTPHFVIAI